MKVNQGRFRLDIGKRLSPRGWLSTRTGSPGGMVMAPRLTESKKYLDSTRRHRVGFLGCSVQGQELDSMILVGPFQLSLFCDFENAQKCLWHSSCFQSPLPGVVGANPLGQSELWGPAIALGPVFPYQV